PRPPDKPSLGAPTPPALYGMRATLGRARHAAPDAIRTELALARDAARAGNHMDVISRLSPLARRVRTGAPTEADGLYAAVWALLAVAHGAVGDRPSAAAAAEAAIAGFTRCAADLAPHERADLGTALYVEGRSGQACSELERAIDEADDPDPLWRRTLGLA